MVDALRLSLREEVLWRCMYSRVESGLSDVPHVHCNYAAGTPDD